MGKPDYLIIGVQKGGTTSAIHHFNQNPQIYLHSNELHFFDRPERYKKGIKYYENHFPDGRIKGEKTPSYHCLPYAIDSIHKHYPDIKLILFLREPVARVTSQYRMALRYRRYTIKDVLKFIKREKHKRIENITERDQHYLLRGYYFEQIQYILTKFSRDQLYVAISEEVLEDPLTEYNKIFEFLGAETLNENNFKYKVGINKGNQTVKLPLEVQQELHRLYSPQVDQLYSFLGRRIPAWEKN